MLVIKFFKDSLLKNMSYMFLANTTSQILVLITLPIVLRKLGLMGWEKVVLAQIVINNILWIVGQGFHFSGTVKISQTKSFKKKNRILTSVIVIQFGIIIFCIAGMFFLSNWLTTLLSIDIIINSLIMAFSSIISCNWYLVGMNLFHYVSIIKFAPKLFLLFLVITEPVKIDPIIYLYFISISELLVSILIWLLLISQKNIKKENTTFKLIKVVFLISFKYFLFQFLPNIKDTFLRLMIGNYLQEGSLAIYSVAERLKGAAVSILHPVLHVTFPNASSLITGPKSDYLRMLYRSFKIQFFCSMILMIFFVLFTRDIIQFFAGSEFKEASEILQILAFGILIIPITEMVLNNILIANNRRNTYGMFLIVQSLIISFVSAIMILIYNLQSLVLSIVISETLILLMVLLYIKKTRLLSNDE